MKLHRNHKNYSAIILAGGNSSRMGFPKPWLKTKDDVTFLATIISKFKQLGIDDIVVVLNEKFTTQEWKKELSEVEQNVIIIKNSKPENGRLYSLQLGLRTTTNNPIIIHNVDNPFVENNAIEQLISQTEANEISIPSYKGKGGHPVIISKLVKEEIITNYQHYKTLKDIFSKFPKKRIEVNSNSILKNINTPQELEAHRHEFAQ